MADYDTAPTDPMHGGKMSDDMIGYRCKLCGDAPEPTSHHKMASCGCGALQVDRGWYGSRVVWDGKKDDVVEELPFHVLHGQWPWKCDECGNEYSSLIDAVADHDDADCTLLPQPMKVRT